MTSAAAGIDCGSDCSNDYDYGTEVTPNATPGPNSLFTGWSGACAGTAACVVTPDQARQVTASFALEKRSPGVTRSGNGSGHGHAAAGGSRLWWPNAKASSSITAPK